MLNKNNIFNQWLSFIETFPLVSGFQWTSDAQQEWLDKLNQHGLVSCFDRHGNILLGAPDEESWYQKISANLSYLLQAHIDHPGVIVLSESNEINGWYRYNAFVQGGLHKSLLGFECRILSQKGQELGVALIDQDAIVGQERFVSFKTKDKISLPAIICGPATNPGLTENNFMTGWGLDNHVGCALVLTALETHKTKKLLGLLTVDEEVGCGGLRRVLRYLKSMSVWQSRPVLVSVETTREYPDVGFMCGQGARWRTEDAHAKMDEDLMEKLKNLSAFPAVPLNKGGCEAGLWSAEGGRAVCLTLPCLYYHNGAKVNEWRAEEVASRDVDTAINELDVVIDKIPLWLRETKSKEISTETEGRSATALVEIHDPIAAIRKSAIDCADYLTCLKTVLPAWNNLNQSYGIKSVKLPQDLWPQVREKLIKTETVAQHVAEKAEQCAKKAYAWLGIQSGVVKPIPVHLLSCADFNAANRTQGICLSLDQLQADDLDRVLIHEMTHWVTADILKDLCLRPLLSSLISEGLACLATIEILGIPPEQALGLTKESFEKYGDSEKHLKSMFQNNLQGKVWDITHSRHEVVRPKAVVSPYQVTQEKEWMKYGYYLGVRCFEKMKTAQKLEKPCLWLKTVSQRELNQDIDEFLVSNVEATSLCA